jgi:NTE family protein
MADESKDLSNNNNLDLSNNNNLDLSNNNLDLSNNNNLDISKNEINCLCFSGGGIKGFSFIGILEKLLESNIIELDKINKYVGTSVGSIISFFLILGYTIQEIKDFVLTFNFSKLNGDVDCVNLFQHYGINTGDKMKLLFTKFLENKFNIKDITFEELFNLTQKHLLVIGTNLTKGREELFSLETTPTMSVITAIRISISVPIIFTPVNFNDNLYVDGALVNNFPINYCQTNTTYGFYIKNCNENVNVDSIQSFIIKCLNVTSDTISEKNLNIESKNIIKIINPNPEFTKFDLTVEYKKELIDLGYKVTENFLCS